MSSSSADGPAASVTDFDHLDRRILHIAVPSLFALALEPLLAAVDTAFVGRLPGEEPLAALAVSASLFGLVYASFNFFANAATPVIAARKGLRGDAAACDLAATIVAIAAALGVGAMVLLQAAAPRFLDAMGVRATESPTLFASALRFIRVRALSAPAVIAQTALNGAFRALGDARSSLAAALGASAVNLSLDLLFIFGLGWGVAGAAAATAVAEWCSLGYLAARAVATRARAEETRQRLLLSGGPRSDEDESAPRARADAPPPSADEPLLVQLAPFLRGSAATIVRSLSLQLFFAATTYRLSRAGAAAGAALASHQLLMTVYSTLSFATDSLAIAAQQIVAVETRASAKRAAASRVLRWGCAFGVASGAALAAGAAPLVAALARSPLVRAATTPVLRRLAAPLQPLAALVFAADGVLQGSLDFKFEAAAMLLACAVAGGALLVDDHGLHAGGAAPRAAAGGAPEALWAAWRAVAVLQAVRFGTFAWRYWYRGPLVIARAPAGGEVVIGKSGSGRH